MKRVRVIPLLAALCGFPAAAVAGGTLEGRVVTLNVETWDEPGTLLFQSIGRTVKVSDGVEFGMGPEFRTPGFDVVPVQVEIKPQRIEFSYGEGKGQFWDTTFNGYVLRFVTDCALIDGFAIDPAFTTMAVTEDDIHTDGGALYINVAGRDYGPDQRLALDVIVGDCLLG
jgi:hypothetical protein